MDDRRDDEPYGNGELQTNQPFSDKGGRCRFSSYLLINTKIGVKEER